MQRRTRAPQSPLPREILRSHLMAVLQQRFAQPVTIVVGGAGFGKTTVLGQAFRANLAAPRGIDAWVSCEMVDEDPRRLAEAIVTAVAPGMTVDAPLDSVLAAIRRAAPVDVCILLDDLHEIPTGSAGMRLVSDVIAVLPANGHVVIASRVAPPVPLARRRAAGGVVDVDVADLAFRPDEVAALARMYDKHHGDLPDLAGWPSLVALALSARRGATVDFLLEEIVTSLSGDDRRTLLAMTTLGWGTLDDAIAVGGEVVSTSRLTHLVRTVPLVSGDQTHFSVHQLWEDALSVFDESELADARTRALALLAEHGDVLRLGSVAIRWHDVDALVGAAVALVRTRLGTLPIETAQRWLVAAGAVGRHRPEMRLLELAVRHAVGVGENVDEEFDRLIAAFGRRPDGVGCAEAIAVAAIAAYDRRDLGRLVALAERSRSLPPTHDVASLRFLTGAIDASMASVQGDAETALRIISTLPFDAVPAHVTELVTRLHVIMLSRTGRATEALAVAQTLASSIDPHVRRIPAYMRWQSGDPSELVADPLHLQPIGRINDRDGFAEATEVATVAASVGNLDEARSAREAITKYLDGLADARDSAIGAGAIACTLLLEHDDAAARAVLAGHLAAHPIERRAGMLHLRRHLAVAYLLDDGLRAHWDSDDLGPAHLQARDVARRLLAARRGEFDPSTLLDAGAVFTRLPLPWSVELAVRTCHAAVPGGPALLSAIAEWSLAATRTELERLAVSDNVSLARTAATLLDGQPVAAGPPVQIDLLGPMRVSIGGELVDSPELRRSRVRTVIALLAVRGPLRRDQIIDVVWPDADLERGRQNLRTTLARLRRVFGPASQRCLRTTGDLVSLGVPPAVDVDLWQFRRDADAADTSFSDPSTSQLHRAVARWRGDPIPDLDSVVGLDGDVEQVRSELVDGCLRLGEQLLATGRFDQALACVERCRRAAPYSERAHRLAIAVLLQLGDHDGLARRVRDLTAMLDDLGVGHEPATAMLLTRAEEALGPRATP